MQLKFQLFSTSLMKQVGAHFKPSKPADEAGVTDWQLTLKEQGLVSRL